MVAWAMMPEERYVLHRATVRDRGMRAVVARAHFIDEASGMHVDPDDEASDMLLVAATVGELNDLYTLVEVAQDGWLETGSIDKNVAFDPKQDVKGPIVVAAALERSIGDRKQRVVVTGSGHFLANQFVGTLGNLDLGVNMLNWLAGDEALITVQPRTRSDLTLEFSRGGLALVGFGFLLVLPLALLVCGGVIWWRRRKA